MKQIFFKSNPTVDDFKSLIKASVNKSDDMVDNAIEKCVIFWIDNFYQIPNEDIMKYPMKHEATVFLKNLLPAFSKSLQNQTLNPNYAMCVDSLSLFVPPKEDWNEIFSNFVNSLFDLTTPFDIKYKSILSKFLKSLLTNKNFQTYTITQDNLIHFWSSGIVRPSMISELVFNFLTEAVKLTNQKKIKILTEPLQQLIVETLKDINSFGLRFACFCYNYCNDFIPKFEDHFSDFLRAIVKCEDGICFNDLLFVKTRDPEIVLNGFNQLASSESPKLIQSLLAVIKQNRLKVHFQIIMFLGSLKILDREGQTLFLSLISNDIVDLLFPPRLSFVDCVCLTAFSKANIKREKAIKYLDLMLIPAKDSDKEEFDRNLNEDFEKREGFNDLIVCLLSKLDSFDQVSEYFSQICVAKSSKIIKCLEFICQTFPPISFLQQISDNSEVLKNIGFFKSSFPFILRDNMTSITREVLKDEVFIEFIINNEQFEVLQALSSNGPHPIIDKLILASSIPKKLAQEEIKCLIYDIPFPTAQTGNNNANEEESRMIRIPSLIPYLQNIEFNSLFDQYVAAQYLISNEFIRIDDPSFVLLGKQFLTPQYVNEMVSKRIDILDKLTKDDHSLHKSVFQLKKDQENSFISFDLPATIEFKVDKSFYSKKVDDNNPEFLLLCTFSEFSIFLSSNKRIIYCSSNNFIKSTDSSLECDLDKWHILKVSKVSPLHYNVNYDGVGISPSNIEININKKLSLDGNMLKINSLLVVGSPLLNPKATFYININHSNKIIQMGDGIVTAHYRGICYYKTLLNIDNRLMKKALQTNDANEFNRIILILVRFASLNRKKYQNSTLNVSNLEKIRQLLIAKRSLITDKLINDILVEFTEFSIFEVVHAFVDYDLWRDTDLTSVFNFLYNLFMLEVSPTSSSNLKSNGTTTVANQNQLLNHYLNFFMDLCQYSNDEKYFSKISSISSLFSFSDELLFRFLDYQEFCDDFFEKNPNLLTKVIPLKYLVYLSFKTALQYLIQFSLIYTKPVNEFIGQSDMNIMISQIAFYSNFVNEKKFWNSMITLLYSQKIDDFSELNSNLVIKNESVLKIIFSLIPKLALLSIENSKEDNKNDSLLKMFLSITEFVKTLFANNKIADVNVYIKELVGMIRMNCFTTSLTALPIIFNEFESNRKALSVIEYLPNINEEYIHSIIDYANNIPDVKPISFSYFGIEIPYSSRLEKKQNYEEYENYFTLFDSFEFKQIFEIIIIVVGLFDDDMKKTELLRCLFACGIDTSTKASMDFHQSCVIKYLDRIGLDHAVLTLLNETVLIGYWENNLLLLFDIVVDSYSQKLSCHKTGSMATKVQKALEIENDILVFELVMKVFILLNKKDFMEIKNEKIDFIMERLDKLQKDGNDQCSPPDNKRFCPTYLHYYQCISGIIQKVSEDNTSNEESELVATNSKKNNNNAGMDTSDGTENSNTSNSTNYPDNDISSEQQDASQSTSNDTNDNGNSKATTENDNNNNENENTTNSNEKNTNKASTTSINNTSDTNKTNTDSINNTDEANKISVTSINNTNKISTDSFNNTNSTNRIRTPDINNTINSSNADNNNNNAGSDKMDTENQNDDNQLSGIGNKLLDAIINHQSSNIAINSYCLNSNDLTSNNYSLTDTSFEFYDPNLINGFEEIDQFLVDYKQSNKSFIRELNKKYIEIRMKTTLSHYDSIYLTGLKQKKKSLSDNLRFLFEKRYNFYSQRNEKIYFDILTHLPKEPSNQYQITSTVHPFSPPTLYVPFYSKCNCDNFRIYPKFETTTEELLKAKESQESSGESEDETANDHKKTITRNAFGAINEKAPRILYYNHNYHNYSFNMKSDEYVQFFTHFESQIESMIDIHLISCADQIECVLVKNKTRYMIITYAKTVEAEKNKFTLLEPKFSLLASTFLDICVSGLYGRTTLFFGHLILMFDREEITISIPRIFCFQHRAIEIWFEKGYSLYLIFKDENKFEHEWCHYLQPHKMLPYAESIFSLSFSSHITTSVKNRSDLVKFRIQWVNNRISSFIYLLILNFYADRSFTNICQYFVMPWIQEQRDLNKPMGMQTEPRASDFREKYRFSYPDSHFYGSLYSSPAIVIRFMVRVQPFTNFLMDLQNGFDKADRLFFDIDNEYQSASEKSNHNVEELIPELFMLPEVYLNVNQIPFPRRMRGQIIDNCTLPESNEFNNWVQFVWEYRKKLDDAPNLEKWIDLIFGVNSRGQIATEKENLFYPSTYGLRPQFIDDHAFESLMLNFGQVPTQLFYEEHPSKNTIIFSRWPLLTETDSISFQLIHTDVLKHDYQNDNINMNSLALFNSNGTLIIKSCMSIFEEANNNKKIYCDNDDEIDTSRYQCCSFSIDHFFFCIVFESGTVYIYRAICEVETKILYYKQLSVCYLPETEANFASLRTTCVVSSSHLFLVCEVIDRFIFCFQINGTFIRTIPCSTPINKVMINDSYQSIFAIQDHQIEVFTINGTKIAAVNTVEALAKYKIASNQTLDESSKILSSSISMNDTSVYLATGHKNGLIVLWNIDPKLKILCVKKIIVLNTNLVVKVNENKLAKNDHSANLEGKIEENKFNVTFIEVASNGSALYAFCGDDENDDNEIGKSAYLLTSRETKRPLVSDSAVLQCAGCKKKIDGRKRFVPCSSCGAYFCNDCIQKSGGEIVCNNCLAHIADYSDVIDSNI